MSSGFYGRKASIYCAFFSSIKGHCVNNYSDVTQMKCFILTHNKLILKFQFMLNLL